MEGRQAEAIGARDVIRDGVIRRGARIQAGVAILSITVTLLVVSLLAVLVVGRVGWWEQHQAGIDARSKEVHAAAAGGLAYAVNWLESLARDSHALSTPQEVFLHPQRWEEGFLGVGARLMVNANHNSDWLPTGTVQLADEEHELYPIAMTADDYEYEWVYTALTSLDSLEWATLMMIEVVVTARATGDSHVKKTVGMDVIVGFSPLFPWSGDTFSAPPLVVEECITGEIQGQPAIMLTEGPALATTLGEVGAFLTDCLSPTGFLECVPGQDSPTSSCVPLPGTQVGLSQPAGSLWSTVFGAISRNELKTVAERYPERLLWIDDQASHPGWDGDQWQQSVGTTEEPVVLFFDKSVGCPAISGPVQVYGLVYFEDDSCEMHRWDDGILHGTLAIAGELREFEGDMQLLATELDFSGGLVDPRFGWTYRLHYFPVPGSWRDFGF